MRRIAGALLGALLGALVLVTAASAAVAPPAAAADSRAVVVIDTSQGSRRAVISFSGTITGIQALQLAGANPVTYGFAGQGAAVCALDGVGHPATDACLGTPSDPRYWAYFRAGDGAQGWSYSNQCACTTTVGDGDVEGWRFGTGQQPPFSSFCAVAGCAPPPTEPPPAPVPPPAGNGSGATTGGGSTGGSAGGVGATTPGATVGGVSAAAPTSEGEPSVNNPDDVVSTTAPVVPPSTRPGATTRGEDVRESAAGLPRVDDSGGSGSPWGAIVALAVVAGLGVLAVVVRRRRSTA